MRALAVWGGAAAGGGVTSEKRVITAAAAGRGGARWGVGCGVPWSVRAKAGRMGVAARELKVKRSGESA